MSEQHKFDYCGLQCKVHSIREIDGVWYAGASITDHMEAETIVTKRDSIAEGHSKEDVIEKAKKAVQRWIDDRS